MLEDGLPPRQVLLLRILVGSHGLLVLLVGRRIQRRGLVQDKRLTVGVSPAQLEDVLGGIFVLSEELLE